MRDRLHLKTTRSPTSLDADDPPYFKPGEGLVEYQYMMERRKALDGRSPSAPPSPARSTARRRAVRRDREPARTARRSRPPWPSPACCATCCATNTSARDRADHPRRGPHVRHGRAVPRAEHLRLAGPEVRAGRPRPAAVVLRVGQDGQILEEGITEAGSMASFIAAGTSYATRGVPMVPFYTSTRCSASSGSAT
jgi:pyruvate dehydrogenase E1 component